MCRETQIPDTVRREYVDELRSKYSEATYNLFTNNCNNFSDELAQFLTGSGIPVRPKHSCHMTRSIIIANSVVFTAVAHHLAALPCFWAACVVKPEDLLCTCVVSVVSYCNNSSHSATLAPPVSTLTAQQASYKAFNFLRFVPAVTHHSPTT